MRGEIRSAFLMTEPQVASSDATNIECSIGRDGDDYVINGRKWWSSGAGDPRCRVTILMGKTDPGAAKHMQQSMILVPMDANGLTVERALTVYGYDDAPHGHMEVCSKMCECPLPTCFSAKVGGFEIAQGRLGPGRIHHCMRTIGAAEEALELMCRRLQSRVRVRQADFRAQHLGAASRRCPDRDRLHSVLCLKAADVMDRAGNKAAKAEIAMIKVKAPHMALKVIDDAVQAFGGAGRQPGHAAGDELGAYPDASPRRRARRGPQPRDREDRIRKAPAAGQQLNERARSENRDRHRRCLGHRTRNRRAFPE
jgi:acyl-CoA dehydrogenase